MADCHETHGAASTSHRDILTAARRPGVHTMHHLEHPACCWSVQAAGAGAIWNQKFLLVLLYWKSVLHTTAATGSKAIPHLLLPSAELEATEVDDRTEEIAPAPGLPKNAFAPVMDAAASSVACTTAVVRPMVSKDLLLFPKARLLVLLSMGCVAGGMRASLGTLEW